MRERACWILSWAVLGSAAACGSEAPSPPLELSADGETLRAPGFEVALTLPGRWHRATVQDRARAADAFELDDEMASRLRSDALTRMTRVSLLKRSPDEADGPVPSIAIHQYRDDRPKSASAICEFLGRETLGQLEAARVIEPGRDLGLSRSDGVTCRFEYDLSERDGNRTWRIVARAYVIARGRNVLTIWLTGPADELAELDAVAASLHELPPAP